MADTALLQSKCCSKCGETKPIGEFIFSKRDGIGTRCKECERQRSKAKYRRDPKKVNDRIQAYKSRNADKVREWSLTGRERKRAQRKPTLEMSFIFAGDGGAFKDCITCRVLKPAGEFSVHSTHKYGVANRCKGCVARYSKGHYAANGESVRAKRQESYQINGREKSRLRQRKWRETNREAARAVGRRSAQKARSTPAGRIDNTMSTGIHRSLGDKKAGRPWESLVGYTVAELMVHLERQFLDGMTWENHGPVWHIDHVIPRSAFNYEDPDHIDFRRCWSLKNLKPLWSGDNIRKGKKLAKPFQPSLAL